MNRIKVFFTYCLNRIRSSNIGNRIATGAFWSFTGTALAKFLVLIAGIICARILTKDQYGEFGIVRSTINMFVVVGSAGLGLTASKFISEYKVKQKERIPSIYILTNGVALATGLLVTILVLIIAPYIAEHTLHAPHLQNSIRVGALLLFVTVINGAQTGTLTGFEDFKSIAINTLFGSIAESVFMLIGAYFWGVFGAVLGFGMGFIVIYFANFISIKRLLSRNGIRITKYSFNKVDFSLLYKFSLPAALSSLMVAPTIWVVKSLLVNNSGFSELAVFEAADQWKIIILFVPTAIAQVVLPILSSMVGEGDNRFWKVLKTNLFINAGVAFCIALLVCVLSPFIMRLYGEDYHADYWTLVILAISTIFNSIASVVGLAIYSRSKMWIGLSFNLLWALMVIGFSLYFISLGFGARGLAMAFTIAYCLHSTFQIIYLKTTVK